MTVTLEQYNQYRPLGFLVSTVIWSTFFWSLISLLNLSPWHSSGQILFLLGGLGPLIFGAIFAYKLSGENGLQSLIIRSIDPSRVSVSSWLFAILFMPAITLLAMLVSNIFAPYSVNISDLIFAPRPDPGAVTLFAFFVLVLGPITEEIGWRGYGLDALQSRFGPLVSSCFLALIWCLWHAPLLTMDGFYDRFGYRPDPVLFCYDLFLATVIMTWLYNRSNRSILVIMVFHFMLNLTSELAPGNYLLTRMITALTTLVVAAIIANWVRDYFSVAKISQSAD